jgi:decaprenylphospho-beta-D-ribofuranose 2-oxidase
MTNFVQRDLAGWGRYPTQACQVARPEKRRELSEATLSEAVPDVIARGLGRSYGDTALNQGSGVVLLEKLNRFLNFNAQTGILHAEGGVSLATIVETFVPRGYFLPVTPGTRFVTLGGAIACDVHGKNHRVDGCLSEFVTEFDLLLASGEVISCSRTHNSEAFWTTVGGLGLTGVIVTVKLRLMPIETAFMHVNSVRTRELDETLAQLEGAKATQYCVAWIDGLAGGKELGRGVCSSAHHASLDEVAGEPLDVPFKRKKSVPRDLPDFALNPLSVKAFNAAYYASHGNGEKIESFDTFFWPLDAVADWNRIYGARGMVQHQCVLPFETARGGLKLLLETISASGHAAFLGVLKIYGEANAAPLSFPMPGYSLALDFPATPDIEIFMRQLDKIALDYGGRVYLAKDATSTPDTVRRMYPRLEEFEAVKAKLDPQGRFQSSLSRRLGIGGIA